MTAFHVSGVTHNRAAGLPWSTPFKALDHRELVRVRRGDVHGGDREIEPARPGLISRATRLNGQGYLPVAA